MPNNKKKANRKKADSQASQQQQSSSGRKSTGPVGKDGRMPEKDGRRFYQLLSILAMIAVPKLNLEREAARPGSQLSWYADMARNTMETRQIVMIYILQQIDWLVEQLENPCHDDLIRQIMGGRRLSDDDKAQIQSWKLHVEDDFFVVDHKDHEGMIFVQVGRMQNPSKEDRGSLFQGDFHEPRCFVVQGLADPLHKLLARPASNFQERNLDLREAYPDLKHLAMIHTALLPYMGGITYMTLLCPPHHLHVRTPQQLHKAIKLAVKSYRALFADSDATTTTTAKLYRRFDLVKDAAICRLASDPMNQGIPVAWKDVNHEHDQKRQEAGTTPVMLKQVYWQPSGDRNNPDYMALRDRATGGPDTKPFCLEGWKTNTGREVLVKDKDPCPFHKRFGQDNASFDSCCKRLYLQRLAKAQRALHQMRGHLMWDPLQQTEIDKIDLALSQRNDAEDSPPPLDIVSHMRIAYQDIGATRLKVPPQFVSVVKERMDYSPYFHATLEYRWVFWGYIPIKITGIGSVMSFGDVMLDPQTGVLEAGSMTSGRMKCLIYEMKRVCTGLPILEAVLEMQPPPKVKPDPQALEENRKLLQEGLNVDVKVKIDKETNEGMAIHCAYCGASEKDGVRLQRCACKTAYYCSKSHQKAHWKSHKTKCNRSREGA